MKKCLKILFLMVSSLLLWSCASNGTPVPETQKSDSSNPASFHKLSQGDAKNAMDQNKNHILLDVRTPEEYAELHIPGSMLIPLDTLEAEAQEQLADKEAEVYVYCRSGRRSAAAAQILVNLGYTKVYDIGGINTWPFETEKGSK